MYRLKRSAPLVVALLMLATPCLAEENAMQSLFKDVFYGALTGGVVGGAVLAFTKQPGKHLDYLGYGAAGGVLVGATYGAVAATRSLAELKDGKVKFALPTIIPEFREPNSKGQTCIFAKTELFRGSF